MPSHQFKSVAVKLMPFVSAVVVYFSVFISSDIVSLSAFILKCSPVIGLLFFVRLHGISRRAEHAFSRRIFIGLIFGCIGDACLIVPDLFLPGMAAFAVGHGFYISALGFRPLNLPAGLVLFTLAALAMRMWLHTLDSVLMIGVPVYAAILTTMTWRTVASVPFSQGDWTWSQLATCLGGLFFAGSDAFIAFDKFHAPIPHSQMLIMTTYYAAQLGIALSVVDNDSRNKRE